MTLPVDKDMKYLSDLVSTETSQTSNANDALTHKLLYLILEEAAASRRQAEHTNKLLEEISDSLKKSTRAVKRLVRATMPYHEDDYN
jgi:hypothetical protein